MENQFGYLLRNYRVMRGISRVVLAEQLGCSPNTISLWERNIELPEQKVVEKIGNILTLSQPEVNNMLAAIDCETCAPSLDLDISGEDEKKFIEIQTQITDIKNSLAQFNRPDAVSPEIVKQIKEDFDNLEGSVKDLTAPVSIPSRKNMTVQLVPITELERLEEYGDEAKKWFSATGLFLGAIIGILTNLATGGSVDDSTWVVGGVFVLGLILTASSGCKYNENGRKQKEKIRRLAE